MTPYQGDALPLKVAQTGAQGRSRPYPPPPLTPSPHPLARVGAHSHMRKRAHSHHASGAWAHDEKPLSTYVRSSPPRSIRNQVVNYDIIDMYFFRERPKRRGYKTDILGHRSPKTTPPSPSEPSQALNTSKNTIKKHQIPDTFL